MTSANATAISNILGKELTLSPLGNRLARSVLSPIPQIKGKNLVRQNAPEGAWGPAGRDLPLLQR